MRKRWHVFRMALSAWVVAAVLVASACAPPAELFRDEGAGDGTTGFFALAAGSYVVRYDIADRDPFWGCAFSVALVRQPPDNPLADGVVVAASEEVRVNPRGRANGTFLVNDVDGGAYFLRMGGSCSWDVSVSGRGWL